jgi:hypothetical protein
MSARSLFLLSLVLLAAGALRARRRGGLQRAWRQRGSKATGQVSELYLHAEGRLAFGIPISDGDAVSSDAMETPDRTARSFADFS